MTRIGISIALLAIAMAGLFAVSLGASTAGAQSADPLEAVEDLIAAANETFPTGDPEPFANAFTEDGLFANRTDGFAVVGRPAMVFAFGQEQDENFSVTLGDSEVDGNTVTGSVDVVDQDTLDAGVSSHIELFTATVEDGLVSSLVLHYDLDDPDTATYFDYITSQEEGDEGPLEDAIDIGLTGDQPGTATIAGFDEGVTLVAIGIDPPAEGDPQAAGLIQPAHIHTGTCDEPGGIVYPLAYPVNGFSFTLLSASAADLLSHDYIVNVHLSEGEPTKYVSCGVLETADGGHGLPGTGTGGSSATDLSWLIALLALVGAASVIGARAVGAPRR